MKRSNKIDFKKAILTGIAGGIVLTGQLSAEQEDRDNGYSSLLAHNCGGQHGCGHNGETDENSPPTKPVTNDVNSSTGNPVIDQAKSST